MFQIPWNLYSEEEIQEILVHIFKCRGYHVYNIHKTDRRGEGGVDLECTKTAETDKTLISVKRRPQHADIAQLNALGDKTAVARIYVYIGEPATSFKEAMETVSNKISFWNSQKLTFETFTADLEFSLWLIIDNLIMQEFFETVRAFYKMHSEFEQGKQKSFTALPANKEMLRILYQAKDRSASLYRSLQTLQTFFEDAGSLTTDNAQKGSISDSYLKTIFGLHSGSLKPLCHLLQQFIHKYPCNFLKFCEESEGRSNWLYFSRNLSSPYAPHAIIPTLEKINSQKGAATGDESIGEILAHVSDTLAWGAYWLEDTVDDLLRISLSE